MAMVRLQKVLSERGVASRRKAEELIAGGHVKVNGRIAQLGDKVDDRKDIIHVRGKKLGAAPAAVYVALNKPRGYITTLQDEKGRKCVEELVRSVGVPVYPIGRLDKDSEGLLLLTNDGDLINALMRGANRHEKEYIVKVNKEITDSFIQDMGKGVYLKELERTTRECEVEKIGKFTFRIILTQGLNRQIRRMCQEFGYQVVSLKRIRINGIELGKLTPGQTRPVEGAELKALYQSVGM